MADSIKGYKNDKEKIRWGLLSYDALEQIAKVMTFGAEKYAPYNWAKGMFYERVFSALQRHLTAWYLGEDNDSETGLSHLAHAGCCLMFLLSYQLWGYDQYDDRPSKLNLEQFKDSSEINE